MVNGFSVKENGKPETYKARNKQRQRKELNINRIGNAWKAKKEKRPCKNVGFLKIRILTKWPILVIFRNL